MTRALTLAAIALAVTACHNSPEQPPHEEDHPFIVSAFATGQDSVTGDTLTCGFLLQLPADLVHMEGLGAGVSARVMRTRVHAGAYTTTDTTIESQEVQTTRLGTDSLRVVLSSPIVDTLITTRTSWPRESYSGPWLCSPELPLGRVFRQPISGQVVVDEMLPID